ALLFIALIFILSIVPIGKITGAPYVFYVLCGAVAVDAESVAFTAAGSPMPVAFRVVQDPGTRCALGVSVAAPAGHCQAILTTILIAAQILKHILGNRLCASAVCGRSQG